MKVSEESRRHSTAFPPPPTVGGGPWAATSARAPARPAAPQLGTEWTAPAPVTGPAARPGPSRAPLPVRAGSDGRQGARRGQGAHGTQRRSPGVGQRNRQRDAEEGVEGVALLLAARARQGGPSRTETQDPRQDPCSHVAGRTRWGWRPRTCTGPGTALERKCCRQERTVPRASGRSPTGA